MQNILYHMHDKCCNHSTLTLDDAVKYALKHKYKILYWTEHTPISIKCGFQHRRPQYKDLHILKNKVIKYNKLYKGKLTIHLGYEAEFNKNNHWYYEKLARDPICEFMILGVHFYGDLFKETWPYRYTINNTSTLKDLKEFYEQTKLGLESGLFSWMAHPEIWLNSYAKWDKYAIDLTHKIINLLLLTHTPAGFNVNFKDLASKSKWHYPNPNFWKEVKKTNLPVIVESDAHDLQKITVEWLNQAHKIVKEYGVSKNIVKQIPINYFPKKPLLIICQKNLINFVSKKLINSLLKNNIQIVLVDSNVSLQEITKYYKIHSVWTIVMSNCSNILKQLKNTSYYVVSNKPNADLTINNFKKIKCYKDLIKTFIKDN